MPGVVEPALGNTANQGHLTAFEPNPDGTAGAGGLSLAAASAGFAMTAGFTLAKPFSAMLGSRSRSQSVESHKSQIAKEKWLNYSAGGRGGGACKGAGGGSLKGGVA
jgi:hypothetical protein